jgi:hypothetical protein
MLRVSAVKELPTLSRLGDAGPPDRERSLDDCKSPGVCLGGCIVLVESRRVRERRLRPQAGCHVQRLLSYPSEWCYGDLNGATTIRLCY